MIPVRFPLSPPSPLRPLIHTHTHAAQNGLLRLLSYLLQTLSANEPFGKSLNQTIRITVPARWGVMGSAVDFMIVASPLPLLPTAAHALTSPPPLPAVDIQYSNHPRPEPPLPSTNHLHRQHLPLHHQHWRPSVGQVVGSV